MKPRIAITVGDFNGIGPEIVLRSISTKAVRACCVPVLVGPENVFRYYADLFHIPFAVSPLHTRPAAAHASVLVASSHVSAAGIAPGTLSRLAGQTAAAAITSAAAMAVSGEVDALVTAPVSKQAMHRAGVRFPGQTEMVQHLSRSPRVAMMLVMSGLRVGLVTIHIPIAAVARTITPALLASRISVIHAALRQDWGITQPHLAVLGLNPHAGEGGDIGTEERRTIVPVLRRLQRRGMHIAGPFPADAFFARYTPGVYDGVVAMYHDQGLIPLKMSAAGHAVNVSVGLRIVRTSPDHGTAFDIAGKGVADPASMVEAILLAAQISRHRSSRIPRA
jgi:4-hydroxythreonine-4-phosphate dehydrogenase